MRTSMRKLAALILGSLALGLAAAPARAVARQSPLTCQAALSGFPGATDPIAAPPGVDPEADPPGSGPADGPSTAPAPRLVEQTPPLATLAATAWSVDSQRLAAGAVNGQVVIWNTDGEIVDRTQLPVPDVADHLVLESLVLGPTHGLAWAWILADPAGTLVCGLEYRWRLGSSAAPSVRLVVAPTAIAALPAGERLAAWLRPDVRPPAPAKSPDGQWIASVEPAGPLSTQGLALSSTADPSHPAYLGRLALAAEIYGHEPELFAAIAGQPGHAQIAARNDVDLPAAISPSRRRAAWIESAAAGRAVLLTFDFETAAYRAPVDVAPLSQLAWLDDSRLLVSGAAKAGKPMIIDVSTGGVRPAVAADCRDPQKGGFGQSLSGLADLCQAAAQRAWAHNVGGLTASLAPRDSAVIFWTAPASANGGRQELFRLHELPGRQLFLASAPDGRFESNLAWDTPLFEWVMPEAPNRALPAQMLIRDYFQPGLTHMLTQCAVARPPGCAARFKPSVDIASIDYRLPVVAITDVQPIGEGLFAKVTTQTSGVNAYDLRLFRDGQLVEEAPDPAQGAAMGPASETLTGKDFGADRNPRGDARQSADGSRARADPTPPRHAVEGDRADRRPGKDLSPARTERSDPPPSTVVERPLAGPDRASPAGDGEAGEKRTWWELNALPGDSNHVATRVFTVRLPSGDPGRTELSAYAFNRSQVISDIQRVPFLRPKTQRLNRRAFVLSIGIDDYQNRDWQLHFAAADADQMVQSLQSNATHQFDFRPMVLKAQGNDGQASKRLIHDALILLSREKTSGGEQDHESTTADPAHLAASQDFRALREPPRGSTQFLPATPDDIVIVTFSGHGWTSPDGAFYLIPSDAKVGPDGRPDIDSLVSATELTDWLRQVDAGEIALVIDACHSAASVRTADFKPAPLGGKGLGQLAFDKGIRVLAASQADAVAMEDPKLGHGLLTYALTTEALDGGGDDDPKIRSLKTSVFRGGPVTLDAWLKYGARRLPSLSQAVNAARMTPPDGAGDIVFDPVDAPNDAGAPAQAPDLFDFTSRTSGATLRGPASSPTGFNR